MAGQSAPHKRGGTHRVKDADKTNSKFDEYKYQQLKEECIARKIYVKDMKKVEMARALVANERELKRAEQEAAKERQRKQQQLQREKAEQNAQQQRAYAERQRKRRQKEERRQREESVSDDTPDEEELQMMKEMFGDNDDHGEQGIVGQALSDESWQSSSTETASCCADAVILPSCRLRLFEWMYEEMLSPTARTDQRSFPDGSSGYWDDLRAAQRKRTYQSDSREDGDDDQTAMDRQNLPVPHSVPYAPIKVYTTESKEKIFLPGQTYPDPIDVDYVPILSRRTRRAARNGILEGVLRCATIEPAVVWLDRTRIQGWNAYMFFSLPLANEAKSLPSVYRKFVLENRELLRVQPHGDGNRGERTKRHTERRRNKGKRQAEVFEASKYRPAAVSYLPAYLDFYANASLLQDAIQDEIRDLSHLFYVRFPGCDVPHYYFWTRTGEWADPTLPNPDWDPELADEPITRSQLAGKHLPGEPAPTCQVPVRIKRAIEPLPLGSPLSEQDLTATILRIEHQLYNDGFKSTIYKYRTKWRDAGRQDAWEVFGRALPLLYPSGALPTTPPVHVKAEVSLASKIASIEFGHAAETFKGDEPWTSRDDEWWDVVIVEGESGESVHDHDVEQDVTKLNPNDLEALYRRASVQMPYTATEACEKWLEDVKPEYIPLSPDSMSDYREEWEAKVFDHGKGFSHVVCPFCMQHLAFSTIEEQEKHMYKHSILPPLQNQDIHRIPTAARGEDHVNHRCSTAVHHNMPDAYDAGAEADSELSSIGTHAQTKKYKNHVRTSADSPSSQDHLKFHLHPLDKLSKRKRMALDFLDDYTPSGTRLQQMREARSQSGHVGPHSLNRRSSAPSAPARKKRRRIADPTYHDAPASSTDSDEDEDFSPAHIAPVKKRRKIADPTYRNVVGEDSSDDDMSTKRRKKRRVVAKNGNDGAGANAMQAREDIRCEEVAVSLVESAGEFNDDVVERDVDGAVGEEKVQEAVVTAGMWCTVM